VLNCPGGEGLNPHGPQPAGLVVMAHTANLLDAMKVGNATCPDGFGYSNNDCRKLSKPLLQNDLFWQNRAFSVDIVGSGTGNQSQQNLIALTPLLNQAATGACSSVDASTGVTLGASFYQDIGLRTDDTVAGGLLSLANNKLTVTNSIFTSDFQGVITGSNNPAVTTSPLVAPYCNGARVPPENCLAQNGQVTQASCKGYNTPVGASETTSLTQVFTFDGIQPTATVDEGHNWLNLVYGPLTLNRTAVQSGGSKAPELLIASADVGIPGGAYSVPPTSLAVGGGSANNAPTSDFFGTPRIGLPTIGAVQVSAGGAAPTLISVTPNLGYRGTTVSVTLLGSNLAGATAVNVTRNGNGAVGMTCNITATGATSVTANCLIDANANQSVRNVSVTTSAGTTGTVIFTIASPPPRPTLSGIAPAVGARSTTVQLTLTGLDLASATAVNVRRPGGGTVGMSCSITNASATSVSANCPILSGAATGQRNVSVTTGGGTSGNQTFTIQ
jgi:hypothetical protein